MGALYALQQRYFMQIIFSLAEHHVLVYKMTQLLSLSVYISAERCFSLGKREVVWQQHLMHPFHHSQHISFLEVALRSPSPSLPRYFRQKHLHSAHNSFKLMSFQYLFSKTDEPLPRLVLAEVRIADVKKRSVAGQAFPKHHHQLQLAVQLRGLHFKHQREAGSGGIDVRLVEKSGMLLGGSSLRVFVYECAVEHTDLLLFSLRVVAGLEQLGEAAQSGEATHLLIFLLLCGFAGCLCRPDVVTHALVPLIKCHTCNIIYNSYKMETLKQIIERLSGDPYQILNTPPEADFAVLKKNYRVLALKYHPDRNKDDEATQTFIKINRAYQFLQEEANRRLYADHIRAIEQQRQRIQAMDSQRRTLIENLKRREQEHIRYKEDLQAEAKRRKEFFQKKEREQEEREQLRRQINQEMTPQQYYEQMSAVVIKWEKGLAFTQKMLQAALTPYGQLVTLTIQGKRRRAEAVFNSIQRAAATAAEFRHPLMSVELKVSGDRRAHLLKALKQRKSEVDLSLSSENIARLKQIINRKSNLYFEHPSPNQ